MKGARAPGLKQYMVTTKARWYWCLIFLCILTTTVVFILPEIGPLVCARYLMGSVFVLWMPGYCLVRSLFPGKKPEKLELIALSLGTSVVLVPLLAFTLHYTPFGIKAASVTVALLVFNLSLSTLAVAREYHA